MAPKRLRSWALVASEGRLLEQPGTFTLLHQAPECFLSLEKFQ